MHDKLYRYSLRLHPDVTSMLYKLPRETVNELWKVFEELQLDRKPEASSSVEGEENTYQIWSGIYRIVYEVWDDEIVVKIVRVHIPTANS